MGSPKPWHQHGETPSTSKVVFPASRGL